MSGVLLPGTAQAPQVLSGYTASGAGGVGFAGSALPGPTAPYAGIWASVPLVNNAPSPITTANISLPPGLPDTALVVAVAVAASEGSGTLSLSDSFATHYTWTSVASSPSGGYYTTEIFLGTRSGAASSDLVGTVTATFSLTSDTWALAVPLLGAQGALVTAGNGNGSATTSGTSMPMGSVSPTMTTVMVGVLLAGVNAYSTPTTPAGSNIIPFGSPSNGFFLICPNLAAGTYDPTATTTLSTTTDWSSSIAVFD